MEKFLKNIFEVHLYFILSIIIILSKVLIYYLFFDQKPLWPDERLYFDIIDKFNFYNFLEFDHKVSIFNQLYLITFKSYSIYASLLIYFFSLIYFFKLFNFNEKLNLFFIILISLIILEPFSTRVILSIGYYTLILSLFLIFYTANIKKNINLSIFTFTLVANIWNIQYFIYIFIILLVFFFIKKINFKILIFLFLIQLFFLPQLIYNYKKFDILNNANPLITSAVLNVQNNDYSAASILKKNFNNQLMFEEAEKHNIKNLYVNDTKEFPNTLKGKLEIAKKQKRYFIKFIFSEMYFKLSLKRLKFFLFNHYPDTKNIYYIIIYQSYYSVCIFLLFIFFYLNRYLITFQKFKKYIPFLFYFAYILSVNTLIIYTFRYKAYVLFILPYLILQSYILYNKKLSENFKK